MGRSYTFSQQQWTWQMNVVLDRIDNALIIAAQKISDAVDKAFGVDHWGLASGILRLGVGCILLSTAFSLVIDSPGAIGFTVTTLFSFIWFIIYKGMSDRLREQRASRDAGRALIVSERRMRSVDLLLMIFLVSLQLPDLDRAGMFFIAGLVSFHLHYYFKAADLPPPSTSTRVAWNG